MINESGFLLCSLKTANTVRYDNLPVEIDLQMKYSFVTGHLNVWENLLFV